MSAARKLRRQPRMPSPDTALVQREPRPVVRTIELFYVENPDCSPVESDYLDEDNEEEGIEAGQCGCGCGAVEQWCDDCKRLVPERDGLSNPRGTSVYWLCDECRERWEAEGKTSD